MNKKKTIVSIIKNGVIFIALIAVTFFVLLKDNNLGDIFSALTKVKLPYIFIGIGCVFVFELCEASNIRRMLRNFDYPCRLIDGLKYALVGFFFSAVTPSASGGQPMQIYYMKKDNVEISHSSLALLMELANFQFVTITIALASLIFNYSYIDSINHNLKILLSVGVMINVGILILLLIAVFSNNIALKMCNSIFNLLSKFKIGKSGKFKEKVFDQIKLYQQGAAYLRQNKKMMLKVLLTVVVQITAIHSVPFLVYKALGFDDASYFTVFSLQAILFVSVSSLPLPGAVGVSETGFLALFSPLYPAGMLSSAMLLSRGISFYLFVAISGVAVIIAQIMIARRASRSLKYSKQSG